MISRTNNKRNHTLVKQIFITFYFCYRFFLSLSLQDHYFNYTTSTKLLSAKFDKKCIKVMKTHKTN